MTVRRHAGAAEFLAAAAAFLLDEPLSANVIATVAARTTLGERGAERGHSPGARAGTDASSNLWLTIHADPNEPGAAGREPVIGAAMRTPPYPLAVSRMPPEAAAALADALADLGATTPAAALPGVTGAASAASAFADAWAARTGRQARIATRMRMYRLDVLRAPQGVSGEAVVADPGRDRTLVAGWLEAFHAEAVSASPTDDWDELARRRLAARQVHLWHQAGRFVSLAAVSSPAAGVARIGPVYTPPGERRNGYGAAVTAAATAAALATGARHVALYADLANPTSNSIYQAIGYQPVHDAIELAFG